MPQVVVVIVLQMQTDSKAARLNDARLNPCDTWQDVRKVAQHLTGYTTLVYLLLPLNSLHSSSNPALLFTYTALERSDRWQDTSQVTHNPPDLSNPPDLHGAGHAAVAAACTA